MYVELKYKRGPRRTEEGGGRGRRKTRKACSYLHLLVGEATVVKQGGKRGLGADSTRIGRDGLFPGGARLRGGRVGGEVKGNQHHLDMQVGR